MAVVHNDTHTHVSSLQLQWLLVSGLGLVFSEPLIAVTRPSVVCLSVGNARAP